MFYPCRKWFWCTQLWIFSVFSTSLYQASNSCVFNWLIFSDILRLLRKFSLYSWLAFSSIWPLSFLTIQSIFKASWLEFQKASQKWFRWRKMIKRNELKLFPIVPIYLVKISDLQVIYHWAHFQHINSERRRTWN